MNPTTPKITDSACACCSKRGKKEEEAAAEGGENKEIMSAMKMTKEEEWVVPAATVEDEDGANLDYSGSDEEKKAKDAFSKAKNENLPDKLLMQETETSPQQSTDEPKQVPIDIDIETLKQSSKTIFHQVDKATFTVKAFYTALEAKHGILLNESQKTILREYLTAFACGEIRIKGKPVGDASSNPPDNASAALFSASLPNSLFALQILSFLTRAEVLKMLSDVKEIKEHFQLSEFYCLEHGTLLQKLEPRSDEEEEEYFSVEEEVTTNEDGRDTHQKSLECEDCVEAEHGRERCHDCNKFSHEDDVYMCESCSDLQCEDCRDNMVCSGFCDDCDLYFCGKWEAKPGCPPVFYCERCEATFCANCRITVGCEKCDQDYGCAECAREVYYCYTCNNHFCFECKDSYLCNVCRETHCQTCKASFTCHSCKEDYCRECRGRAGYCEDCGDRLCEDCAFKCSECETLTCRRRCTKAYKCNECDKEICSDCQDAFQKCCCEKKGKFVLIA